MASFSVGNVLAAGLRLVPSLTLRFAPVIAVAAVPLVLWPVTGQAAWIVLYLLLEPVAAAILTHAASEALAGHRTSALASVAAGLRRALAAFFLMFIVYLVTAALQFVMTLPLRASDPIGGLASALVFRLLFFAIFFALYARWFLAMPAVVVDRMDPGGALSRSGELTRGRRWRIVAILVLLHVTLYAAFIALVLVEGHWERDGWVADDARWLAVVAVATWILYTVVRALLSAAAHHLIQRDVAAASPDELARVFG